MIDGDCLAAFVAIAEERNFSRAADRLGIAQSVASKRLRRLEDQLAARLIDRSLRSDIHLTRVGELFLPEARRTLAQLDRAERAGRNLARGVAGPLRIGFVFSAAMNGTLARLMTGLRAEFPELQFQPRMMETPEQLAGLEAGQLDVALVRPRPAYPSGCTARVASSEALLVCLSSGHRLNGIRTLKPAHLAGERFIVPQFHENVGLIDSIERLASAGGFAMPKIIRTGDFVTAACLASAGDGIVLAPESLANLGLDGIRFRELNDYDERLETVFVHTAAAPSEAIACAMSLLNA